MRRFVGDVFQALFGDLVFRCAAYFLPVMMLGCARAPSPLAPHYAGSIGLVSQGVLTGAEELPQAGKGYRWLQTSRTHFALPRFLRVIEHAAAAVSEDHPGGILSVGDLSARSGGALPHHLSHRSGRDADLLFFLQTLEGVPTTSSTFVHIGSDGLGWDSAHRRYVRMDVEREWSLVRALLSDAEATVEWLFVSNPVKAMLLRWAFARGESTALIVRAFDAMMQPGPPAESHDDHLHVRIACSAEERVTGCEDRLEQTASFPSASEPITRELLMSIFVPAASAELTENQPTSEGRHAEP